MKKLLLCLSILMFSGSVYSVVDLNTATKEELEAVKGLGPAKAEAIIAYRKQHGGFKKVDELGKVKGFGEKTVKKLRNEFTVGNPAKK